MENESASLKQITSSSEQKEFYKKKKIIKLFIYFTLIYFIIVILLTIGIIILKSLLYKYIPILNNLKLYFENNLKLSNAINENPSSFNKDDYISKIQYNDDINFYQNFLQLYVENRTNFYLKGRERNAKLGGRKYNDSNVTTIQDKLNWLIVHENPEYKAIIVDKILLHEYSLKILGKDICVPIIKIYNTSDEIDFNELPDKFALKCNHGCGMNILCNNKSRLNITDAKSKLDKWMNINYALKSFEFQYLHVKKKIFAENYLVDDVNDYKIYCFNGKPKFIRVQKYLPDHSGKINNYYNLDWTLNEIETGLKGFYRRPDVEFEKPKNLDLMLEYSEKLSSEFVFVRVDLYDINGTVYLGEMTFTPSNCGFDCKDYNQSLYLGNMLDLSKVKN